MAVDLALGNLVVGVERPLALVLVPVLAVLLWALVLRRSGVSDTGRRTRVALFSTRLIVAVLLVGAAAGPYTVASRETAGEPRVTMLLDESDSMQVMDPRANRLESAIRDRGIPVSRVPIASGTNSPLGDAVIANVERNGSVLLVSDGQVTGGSSLAEAAEVARGVDATVSTLDLDTTTTERAVHLAGPAKTSTGTENAFLVSVSGVELEDTATRLTVEVDGVPVLSEAVTGPGTLRFEHTFEETGSHRITATIEADDTFAENDVSRKSVRVVEPPSLLYVSRGSYPFESYLSRLYDVTRASEVPADLDPYSAVVIQDLAARDIGNVAALQEAVINGKGLVVVGGANAYEHGNYGDSPVASMLPVRVGEEAGQRARIVLLVDVSGSTEGGMTVQKAIALDALSQLSDTHSVGLAAFNFQAHAVAPIRPLGENRNELQDRIRRLQSGGGTFIAVGLRGAADMLGSAGGSVILISDGGDKPVEPLSVARQLGERGIRVYTVGVGQRINPELLRAIAAESGGSYFRADETSRLRILFGGPERQFAGSGLTVVDDSHFITSGVELTADPGRSNVVAVKDGATFLVADRSGSPAIAAWRFGLGRVVSITSYGADGTLDGLLSSPDSLVLSKSVNWAVGDPERTTSGIIAAPDTRVGEATTIVYRGPSRPSAEDLQFAATGEGTYEATLTPTAVGYRDVLGATVATNYPREYGSFGPSSALENAVETTGGRTFEPGQVAEIVSFVRRQSTGVRNVRDDWTWALLTAALVIYLLEVAARRIYVTRGRPVP